MGREIDVGSLLRALAQHRNGALSARDGYWALKAIGDLRKTSLPECYVDGLHDEIVQFLCIKAPAHPPQYVYLAFHGHDGRASHMKIGVAKDVGNRMAAIYTGCPLPRLWVYRTPFSRKRDALTVERALLAHMSEGRTSGEWVGVGSITDSVAAALVTSLAEVASGLVPHPVEFEFVEV